MLMMDESAEKFAGEVCFKSFLLKPHASTAVTKKRYYKKAVSSKL
jgi:hypothetical protein